MDLHRHMKLWHSRGQFFASLHRKLIPSLSWAISCRREPKRSGLCIQSCNSGICERKQKAFWDTSNSRADPCKEAINQVITRPTDHFIYPYWVRLQNLALLPAGASSFPPFLSKTLSQKFSYLFSNSGCQSGWEFLYSFRCNWTDCVRVVVDGRIWVKWRAGEIDECKF